MTFHLQFLLREGRAFSAEGFLYGYQCFFKSTSYFPGKKWGAQNISPLLDIKNAPIGKNPVEIPCIVKSAHF